MLRLHSIKSVILCWNRIVSLRSWQFGQGLASFIFGLLICIRFGIAFQTYCVDSAELLLARLTKPNLTSLML